MSYGNETARTITWTIEKAHSEMVSKYWQSRKEIRTKQTKNHNICRESMQVCCICLPYNKEPKNTKTGKLVAMWEAFAITIHLFHTWKLHNDAYEIMINFIPKVKLIIISTNWKKLVEKISRIRCRSRRWYEVSKFSLKYFREWHRIRENRENLDPRNISAIR